MTTTDPDKGKELQDANKDWITDEKKMAVAKDSAIYMHPLPADRQIEVSDAVIDGPQSVVFDQAENRLHAQKAVMALTMS
jgi:N-acetylornithine carbamoyltransferase